MKDKHDNLFTAAASLIALIVIALAVLYAVIVELTIKPIVLIAQVYGIEEAAGYLLAEITMILIMSVIIGKDKL